MQTRYTITALVENRPGVLNRVVSIFRRPGLNLDSLTVGRTDRPEVSRMTMVLEGSKADAQHVKRELNRLIHVIKVEDVNGTPHVIRDLALIKVKATADNRSQILQILHGHFLQILIHPAAAGRIDTTTGQQTTDHDQPAQVQQRTWDTWKKPAWKKRRLHDPLMPYCLSR